MTFFPGDFHQIRNNYLTTTVIRDPARRLISQYFQYRRASDLEPSEKASAAKNLGLVNYLRWLESKGDFEDINIACHWLATLTASGERRIDRSNALDLALEASSLLDIVGNTANLEAYSRALSAALGVQHTEVPWLNKTTQHDMSEVSHEAHELARDLADLDYELYRTIFPGEGESVVLNATVEKDFSTFPIAFPPLNFGVREISIECVEAGRCKHGNIENVLQCGEFLTIRCTLMASAAVHGLTLGLGIRGARGELIFGTNTQLLDLHPEFEHAGRYQFDFQLPCNLQQGTYEVEVALHHGASHHEGCEHWLAPAAQFNVVGFLTPPFAGVASFPVQFSQSTLMSSECPERL